MDYQITDIIDHVILHPHLTTREAIDDFFSQFLWSLERAEWDKMCEEEKVMFTIAIDKKTPNR